MKKAIVIVVLLGIVAAGGGVWYFNRPATVATHPAELLPEDTLVMIEAVDLKKSLDEFRAGPLGRAVLGIDMQACMGAFNADPEEIEQVRRLQARVKAGVDSPWFDTLFGDLAVLAVLRPDPEALRDSPERLWHQSAVMVLKPKKPAEMIQWIGRMFAMDVSVTAETESGVRMDRIDAGDGPPLFVAVHRGLGLVALDPGPIVRCLAPSDAFAPSPLAQSPDYAALRAELAGAPEAGRFFVWIDFHGILDTWFDPADQTSPRDAAMAEVEKLWGGFNQARPVIAAVTTDGGDTVNHRWRIRYNAVDLSPDMARMLNIPPESNTTLPWIPESVLYYSWQNNLDQVLESVLDLSRLDAGETEAFRREFATATGVVLEDALGAFGSQFAVMIRDIRTGGIFPVPELALMAEVGRPEIIDRLVESAVRNFGLATATEEYRDGRIRYVALPYGEEISPGYAFREGFLVMASSRGLLKTLLTQEPGGKSLVDSPSFSAVNRGLTDRNNQMMFLQTGEAAERARDLLKWALSLAVMTGKAGDANQMIYLSGKVVEPILEGLSMYPAVGARTVVRENGIESDISVLKPRRE